MWQRFRKVPSALRKDLRIYNYLRLPEKNEPRPSLGFGIRKTVAKGVVFHASRMFIDVAMYGTKA